MKTPKQSRTIGIRFTAEQQVLLAKLAYKTGTGTIAGAIRVAIKELAERLGL